MNLEEIRGQIDGIDKDITELFAKRTKLVGDVAKYKKENNVPIFARGREEEVLSRVCGSVPEELSAGASVLFRNIMDISKSMQYKQVGVKAPIVNEIEKAMITPQEMPKIPNIACPGIAGSNSQMATSKLFENGKLTYLDSFPEVFEAVDNGTVDFGVLPIENSTAGSVREVYELIRKFEFYINFEIKIKIDYVLATRSADAKLSEIAEIFSHEQALAQCADYLKTLPATCTPWENTAIAAKMVADSDRPIAAVCNEECAKLYGLNVLKQGLTNIDDNYTRFICISKKLYPNKKADGISVSLNIPNTQGSLYQLLTYFAVNGVDMTKIESKPLGNKNFDAIFYIDYKGNLFEKNSIDLINHLANEDYHLKFLGNYLRIE